MNDRPICITVSPIGFDRVSWKLSLIIVDFMASESRRSVSIGLVGNGMISAQIAVAKVSPIGFDRVSWKLKFDRCQ